jgi:hypothetical protein
MHVRVVRSRNFLVFPPNRHILELNAELDALSKDKVAMDAEAAAKARQCYLFFAALDQLKIDATAPATAAAAAAAAATTTAAASGSAASGAGAPAPAAAVPSTIVDAMATDA